MAVLGSPDLTSDTDPSTYGYLLKIYQALLGMTFSRTINTATTASAVLPGGKNFRQGDWLIRVDCTSGAVSVNLPDASKNVGQTCMIKKIDSTGNAATLTANGSDKIDGVSSKSTSTQYAIIRVVSVGTGWDVI